MGRNGGAFHRGPSSVLFVSCRRQSIVEINVCPRVMPEYELAKFLRCEECVLGAFALCTNQHDRDFQQRTVIVDELTCPLLTHIVFDSSSLRAAKELDTSIDLIIRGTSRENNQQF